MNSRLQGPCFPKVCEFPYCRCLQECYSRYAGTYKLVDSFKITNAEGWGLSTDGTHLIMSDGTCNICYLDPTSKLTKALRVTDNEGPVMKLNEPEYVNGFLYANIYTTSNIVKIDTKTGNVVGRLDCTSLDQEARTVTRGRSK